MSWLNIYTPNYVRAKLGIASTSQDIFLSGFISNVFINLEHILGYSIADMDIVTNNKIIRDQFLDGKIFTLGAWSHITKLEIGQISATPSWKTLILDQDYQNINLKGAKNTITGIDGYYSQFPKNSQMRVTGTLGLATTKGLKSILTVDRGTGGTLDSIVTISGDGVGASAKIIAIDTVSITFEITNIGRNYTNMAITVNDITGGNFTANLANIIPGDLELIILELTRFAFQRQITKGMTIESERSGNLSISFGRSEMNPLTTLDLYAPQLLDQYKQVLGFYKANYSYPF
jgi:hypothetical protein